MVLEINEQRCSGDAAPRIYSAKSGMHQYLEPFGTFSAGSLIALLLISVQTCTHYQTYGLSVTNFSNGRGNGTGFRDVRGYTNHDTPSTARLLSLRFDTLKPMEAKPWPGQWKYWRRDFVEGFKLLHSARGVHCEAENGKRGFSYLSRQGGVHSFCSQAFRSFPFGAWIAFVTPREPHSPGPCCFIPSSITFSPITGTPPLHMSDHAEATSMKGSTYEEWDRSATDIQSSSETPGNTVTFPAGGSAGGSGRRDEENAKPDNSLSRRMGRSLSQLMRLHAEKGTDVNFTVEEASRVGEVLKQWINSGMSPYEGEDEDFFARSHDDSSISHSNKSGSEVFGRPRGVSESSLLRRSSNPAIKGANDS